MLLLVLAVRKRADLEEGFTLFNVGFVFKISLVVVVAEPYEGGLVAPYYNYEGAYAPEYKNYVSSFSNRLYKLST